MENKLTISSVNYNAISATQKNNISFRLELDSHLNKKGENTVFLITYDATMKKRIKKNVGISVRKDLFNKDKYGNWVSKRDLECVFKNNRISSVWDEFKSTYEKINVDKSFIQISDLSRAVSQKYILKDFITVHKRRMEEAKEQGKISNERTLNYSLKWFDKFLKNELHLEVIDFRQITKEVIIRFEKYLRKSIKNKKGGECSILSVWGVLRDIKATFNYAIREQLIRIEINPFFYYRMPKKVSIPKEKLTIEDLRKFFSIKYEKGTRKYNAQKIFEFQMLVGGCRIKDAICMRHSNFLIEGDTLNLKYIASKTKTNVEIEVKEKLKSLLSEFPNKTKEDGFIFPYLSKNYLSKSKEEMFDEILSCEAQINKQLKRIAKEVGITKNVSSHIARHSMGTLSADDGNIYLTSKMLDHAQVATSQVYVNRKRVKEISEHIDKIAAW